MIAHPRSIVIISIPGARRPARRRAGEANRTALDGDPPGDPAGCTLSRAVKNHNLLTQSIGDSLGARVSRPAPRTVSAHLGHRVETPGRAEASPPPLARHEPPRHPAQ